MLSCVMKRSQTSGYSMRGSDRVGGWCGFVWVHSYNTPLCLDCSASYGPILAHIPPPPSPPDMLQGYRNRGGAWASAYFSFQAQLGLLREKGPSGDLVVKSTFPALENTSYVPSKNEHHPPVLGAENRMKRTCMLTCQLTTVVTITLEELELQWRDWGRLITFHSGSASALSSYLLLHLIHPALCLLLCIN